MKKCFLYIVLFFFSFSKGTSQPSFSVGFIFKLYNNNVLVDYDKFCQEYQLLGEMDRNDETPCTNDLLIKKNFYDDSTTTFNGGGGIVYNNLERKFIHENDTMLIVLNTRGGGNQSFKIDSLVFTSGKYLINDHDIKEVDFQKAAENYRKAYPIELNSPKIKFDSLVYHLGKMEIRKDFLREVKVRVSNWGSRPLIIRDVYTFSEETKALYPKEPIYPGYSDYIIFQFKDVYHSKYTASMTVISNSYPEKNQVINFVGEGIPIESTKKSVTQETDKKESQKKTTKKATIVDTSSMIISKKESIQNVEEPKKAKNLPLKLEEDIYGDFKVKGIKFISTNMGLYKLTKDDTTLILKESYIKKSDISFLNKKKGFVISRDSNVSIYKTENKGNTWSVVSHSKNKDYPIHGVLLKLKYLNKKVGFILVDPQTFLYRGTISRTEDGGKTWKDVGSFSFLNHRVRKSRYQYKVTVFFLFDKLGFIRCNSKFLFTINGGKTWSNAK